MATGFLLKAVLNEAHNTYAFPAFCKRVRFRKSNCLRCVEICPEKVISLDPGPTIGNGCSDCGLCQRVCPSEVFQNEFHTDQSLLNQARAFLGKDQHQPPGGKHRLFVYCHRAENQNKNALLLPCLGRITPNIILGAALSGFDEVVLTKGICPQCRFQQGEKLLIRSITTSRVLLEATGLGQFVISIEEKEKSKEPMLSRREIFSKIANKVKGNTVSFSYHKEKAIREKLAGNLERKGGKQLSPDRELLRRLLKQNRLANASVVQYKPEFPWGKIKIEKKNCSGCGTCVALCPTGAISKKLKNEEQFLYFNSSLCSNCSLCKEACPQGAIDFEENLVLADILEEEAKVVAKIKLASCFICGKIIRAEKGKLCPTCERRQVWPAYVKV